MTHNEQAQGIQPNSFDSKHYTFKQKYGKEYIYDGHPLGETNGNIVPFCNTKETSKFPGNRTVPGEMKYQEIPGGHTVLPGYYSWWGLSLEYQLPQYVTDTVHSNENLCCWVCENSTRVIVWQQCILRNPPSSRDGVKVLWCHSHLVWLFF